MTQHTDSYFRIKAMVDDLRSRRTENGFFDEEASKELYSHKFDTDMLEADVEHGDLGLLTHPNQARELLRLETPELRERAMDEAHTLVNIMGGVLSGAIRNAVSAIRHNIANGEPDKELYGEKFAREAREQEVKLRKATGDPSAIYHPRGLRK